MDNKSKVQIILIIAITIIFWNFTNKYFSKEREKSRDNIFSYAIKSLKEVNPNFYYNKNERH